MTSHDLFAGMPSTLANQILEDMLVEDKPFYRGILDTVAQARKVRIVFLERQPRTERHQTVAATLARPTMEMAASNLLRTWFLKKQSTLLTDFLDGLGIKHEKGVVDNLPDTTETERLKTTVNTLLDKYPHDVVALYLHSFLYLNDVKWTNLDELLYEDPRLELKK
jgi:hypothetical protein